MSKYTLLGSIFITLSVFGLQAEAQTPDGLTPANEGICDSLAADGITKGLYGLCVAFCEAQDHTSIVAPVTEAELQMLMDANPSGRILDSYNKKKTASDPDMPCLVVKSACPCWNDADIQSIDGVMWDGEAADGSDAVTCWDFGSTGQVSEIQQSDFSYSIAQTFTRLESARYCRFEQFRNAPGGASTRDVRLITDDEFNSCHDSVLSRRAALQATGMWPNCQ